MTEVIVGWGCMVIVLWITRSALNNRRNKAAPSRGLWVWLRMITVSIAFSLHVIVSALLYEPVMELFDIDTNGFMNLNGLATFAAIWSVTALLCCWLVTKAEPLFGMYYKPLRVAYLIFATLPLAIICVFLFIVALK